MDRLFGFAMKNRCFTVVLLIEILWVAVSFTGCSNKSAEEEEAARKLRAERAAEKQRLDEEQIAFFGKIRSEGGAEDEILESIKSQLRKADFDVTGRKVMRAAASAMIQLPLEVRAQIWEEFEPQLKRTLATDVTLHDQMYPEGEKPDPAHVAMIARCIREYASAKFGIEICDQLFTDMESWQVIPEIQEAAFDLLTNEAIKESNAKSSALKILLNVDQGKKLLIAKFQESSRVPAPMKPFIELALENLPRQEVTDKILATTEFYGNVLIVDYILERTRVHVESLVAADKKSEARKEKLDVIDYLVGQYPEVLTALDQYLATKGQLQQVPKKGASDSKEEASPESSDSRIPTTENGKVGLFDKLTVNDSAFSRMFNRPDTRYGPLRGYVLASESKLSEVFSIVTGFKQDEESDLALQVLLDGVSLPNRKTAETAGRTLTSVLPPKDFPGRFFQFLSTREEYSVTEVDTYISFLVSHCREVPAAVAAALEKEIQLAEGKFENISWIKKIIGLKALSSIGTSAEVGTVKKFLSDVDSFTESVTDAETGKETEKELLIKDLAQETLDDIAD